MVSGGAVPPPRILNCILVPHRIIKAGVYPQNACGNTPAIFWKRGWLQLTDATVLTGLLIPFAGTSLGAACLFFVRDTMNINLCL
jgi:hypothetical protein